MAVYVDGMQIHKNGYWCHMVADTVEELDAMARITGLRLAWRQTSSSGIIHYDLRASKRELAVFHGAIECDSKKILEVGRRCQSSTQPE